MWGFQERTTTANADIVSRRITQKERKQVIEPDGESVQSHQYTYLSNISKFQLTSDIAYRAGQNVSNDCTIVAIACLGPGCRTFHGSSAGGANNERARRRR